MSDDAAIVPPPEDQWERPITLVIPKLNIRHVLSPAAEQRLFHAIRQGQTKDPRDYFEQLLKRAAEQA